MDLNACLIQVGHITDLLSLGNAAGGADIRLDDLYSTGFHHLLELPTGEQTFAGRHRNSRLLVNIAVHIFMRCGRLLDVKDTVGFRHIAHLDGTQFIGVAMVLEDDIHIRADSLAGRLDAGFQHPHGLGRQQTGLLGGGKAAVIFFEHEEIGLDAVKALLDRDFRNFSVIFRGACRLAVCAPAVLDLAGVGAQAAAVLTAQQLIDRHPVLLALDVPQGHVDRADTAKGDCTTVAAPVHSFVHLFPDHFMLHGIHADDELGQILHHAESGVLRTTKAQTALAIAIDALVGIDAAEQDPERCIDLLGQQQIDLCDFHTDTLPP